MPVAYAPEELAVIAFAMLFAGFVKGATGLGYSTTCLPIMALALGLKASLPLALAPSLASNAAVMLGAGPICATRSTRGRHQHCAFSDIQHMV